MPSSKPSDVPSTEVDAVVIGGGHNGLIAAAYLARAGRSVVVLERREIVGGACVTEEVFPGFRFSRAAYVNSLLRPAIVRELELERRGFRMLARRPSSFTPIAGGGHLFLGADAEENRREIARHSVRDAAAFPRYEAKLDRVARLLEPLLDRPPPDLPPRGARRTLGLLAWAARHGLGALRLGPDLPFLLELFTAPAASVLARFFETEILRATLATDAVIGAMAGPSTPGSGYVLFHHVMGETDGARGVWGYVRGGMGALSGALRSAAEEHGASVLTGCDVAAIKLTAGRATGVVLADGREVRGRVVLSTADPRRTFLGLLPAGCLPDDFRARIEAMRLESGVTKINLALDRLPRFRALDGTELADLAPGPQHRGTIHFTQSVAEIDEAYLDARRGGPSRRPVVEMTIPSAVDDSLAPPGRHVASLFVQYTPYRLARGSWEDPGTKDAFADRVLALIEELAPGFTASVLHRDVLSPLDLERIYGLTGGDIFHGAMSLDQLFWLRPAPGWARHATPVPGLFLAGSGAHPGGGVLGSPGRNAARVALRALRTRRAT